MPLGEPITVTGTLQRGRWGYALAVEGGGVWQLDGLGNSDAHLGAHITVAGTRGDFDLIDVDRFALGKKLPPPKRAWFGWLVRL